MYIVNKDLSIYVTRGDAVVLTVAANNNGVPYVFQAGEVVRFRVFEKKGCHCTVLQKDFILTENVESVDIVLTKNETKFGEIISKPKDYWYEIELNPNYNPQTIVGYDDDGPKLFRLFPEGADTEGGEGEAPDEYVPAIGGYLPYVTEDDNGKTMIVVNGEWQLGKGGNTITVDDKLDVNSTNPVQNCVVTRAISAATTTATAAQETANAAGQLATAVNQRVSILEQNGGGITVDDVLNGESTNPVQNKVVKAEFDKAQEWRSAAANILNGHTSRIDEAEGEIKSLNNAVSLVNDRVLEAQNNINSVGHQAYTALQNTQYMLGIDVKAWGARGDGVKDDTYAIQNALDAAEQTGRPLYFPTGTYLVSKTITTHTRDTDADKQTNNMVIYGAGFGSVIKTTEDFDGDYVFYIDIKNEQPRSLWVHDFAIDLYADVSGIYFKEIGMKGIVENLWITFKREKVEGEAVRAGIFCDQTTVSTFQRIKVQGNIKGYREGNCGIVCRHMHSTKIIDCDVIFCGWGIYLSGGSNNLIEQCRIDENEYGVFQNSSTDIEQSTRAYPFVEEPTEDEPQFRGTFGNLTIRKNRFEANNKHAIYLIAYSAGALNYMFNKQITIADNNFTGLGTGTAMWTDRAVFRKAMRFGRCEGITIENNKFKGSPYDKTVSETRAQNISIPTSVFDVTLRGNVAITYPVGKDEDGNTTAVKTNVQLTQDVVGLGLLNDIELNQTTRGDVSVKRTKIVAVTASGTADVSSSNVVVLNDGVTVSGISQPSSNDLTTCQEVTFIAAGTATVKSTDKLCLSGGVDFVMGKYDTLTLVCAYRDNAVRWMEKCRSVNRAT